MHKIYHLASQLPLSWDKLCQNNLYLQRSFLTYMEQTNNCGQQYYAFFYKNKLVGGFVTFEYLSNLLMFTRQFKLNFKIKYIYLPLSVCEPGIFLNQHSQNEITQTIKSINGLKVILSTKDNTLLPGLTFANYLPTSIMNIKWRTFNQYLNALRSNYRHRIQKALNKSKNLHIKQLTSNQDFDEQLYSLYCQVWEHAQYKLEKLNQQFFQLSNSKIFVFYNQKTPLAFVQLIENGQELIFEFGGFDYAKNHQYDLYYNMLLHIIKYAINHKFKKIDLGQTAEDTKLKLGSHLETRGMFLHHSNALINWLLKKCVRFIEYSAPTHNFNVFRKVSS